MGFPWLGYVYGLEGWKDNRSVQTKRVREGPGRGSASAAAGKGIDNAAAGRE